MHRHALQSKSSEQRSRAAGPEQYDMICCKIKRSTCKACKRRQAPQQLAAHEKQAGTQPMHRHTLQRNSSEQRSRAAGPLSAACEENGQIVMLHVNMCTCVQKQHFVFETHHNSFREFDPVQPDKTDEWICLHVTSTNVFFAASKSERKPCKSRAWQKVHRKTVLHTIA